MENELEQKLAFKIIKNTAWLFEIGTIIDPIFPAPAPCNSKYTICRYYISEETYNCMQSIITFKEIEKD